MPELLEVSDRQDGKGRHRTGKRHSVGHAWGKNKKENRQVRDFTRLSDFPW